MSCGEGGDGEGTEGRTGGRLLGGCVLEGVGVGVDAGRAEAAFEAAL